MCSGGMWSKRDEQRVGGDEKDLEEDVFQAHEVDISKASIDMSSGEGDTWDKAYAWAMQRLLQARSQTQISQETCGVGRLDGEEGAEEAVAGEVSGES